MGQTSDDAWPYKSDAVPQGVVPPRLTQDFLSLSDAAILLIAFPL
jgi:hypothetical protein